MDLHTPSHSTMQRTDIMQLFSTTKRSLNVCAPMVRYSKLPFRELVRRYKCDIVYTPMILANVFAASQYSRDSEFSTNRLDDPVVIQFAASNAVDLANAAELAAPYVSGIDINCGCPQKWAIEEKIGSHLMSDPETVRDMIRQTKARVRIPCSIKIRIHPNLRETEEFVKRALSVGVDFITVHGRTRRQKSTEPVNIEGMKLVKETSTVPVIANGDVFSLQDAEYIVSQTGVNGTMAARGILENPALYAGYNETPWECIEEYVALAMEYGTNAFIFHHHLMYMFERVMSNAERKTFNSLTSVPAILDYLDDNYGPLDIPAAKARLRSPLII